MATDPSSLASGAATLGPSKPGSRREQRRRETLEEALDHAVAVMTESGVGGLTVSEVARRVGIRGPSLYKYFPSLHAMYDALFARGLREQRASVRAAIEGTPRGLARLRAAGVAAVSWSVANPALAQLLVWRPVPGFEPSAETFAGSVRESAEVGEELAEAVRRGELAPEAATPDGQRLLTIVLSGLISLQLANEPGVPFRDGAFTRLIDDAFEMYIAHYRPIRPPAR
jgi:AcrR family transcriptional regulator